ncbi:MAG: hypothetical protein HYR63_28915 [Proteobacteria bacterium]|nr:hypothetical protein [Pseudomonadota bacterium]
MSAREPSIVTPHRVLLMAPVRKRPAPTSRLEGQIRSFWDASDALARAPSEHGRGRMRLKRREAIAILSALALGHPSPLLRRASAGRLASLAPDATAELVRRISKETSGPSPYFSPGSGQRRAHAITGEERREERCGASVERLDDVL